MNASQQLEVSHQGCGKPCARFPIWSSGRYKTRPRQDWLIDGVLVAGGLAALYGQPGAYKTFLALDMALSIAAGIPWADRGVQKRRVLYISAEGAAGLQDRIEVWELAHGIDVSEDFHILTDAPNLLSEEDVTDLLESIRFSFGGELPGLVVADTFARVMLGGDENSVQAVSQVIAAAKRIQDESEATVLFLHHGNKARGDLRGSSAFLGGLDTAIKAGRDADNKGNVVTLVCEKQKDAAEFEPIALQRRTVELADGITSLVFDLVGKVDQALLKALDLQAILVKSVGPDGMEGDDWEALAKERLGIGRSTFHARKKVLTEQGFIEKTQDGRFRPTPKGINAVVHPSSALRRQSTG